MIIYVDESYPDSQEKIILGALFVGQGDHKRLHSRINEIKRNQKFAGEIKYSEITDKTRFRIAKKMVDTFIESKNTFFCSCIIPYSATKLVHYSGIDTNQKRIKIYSDGAKLLILNNIPKDANCDIYFDEEDRIKKTKLYSKLLKAKPVHGGNILSVQPTISSDESRNVLQLCDILTGAIKQNLYPSNTNKSALKREFSAYVLKENGLEGCGEEYWKKSQKRKNHKLHTKFYISHFEIPLTRLI